MVRTEKGLLIYNLDNDELAFRVGQRLENSPPENIIIERYNGPKDYPDSLLSKKKFYQLNFTDQERLYKQSQEYERKIVHPIIKDTIRKYTPKFDLELHSTPISLFDDFYQWFKTRYIWLGIGVYPTNKRLNSIIFKEFPEHQQQLVALKDLPVYQVTEENNTKDCFHSFHGLYVEIWHRDDNPISQDSITVGEILIRDLCEFIMSNYK